MTVISTGSVYDYLYYTITNYRTDFQIQVLDRDSYLRAFTTGKRKEIPTRLYRYKLDLKSR